MNLEDLKSEFDRALSAMSDSDLIKAFAEMNCDVEVISSSESEFESWPTDQVTCCGFGTRPTIEAFPAIGFLNNQCYFATNSYELALAA